MEELQGVHYDAFISYRHSELDSFIAENLHKKLEAFKLPKSARGKAKSGKTKITRIFRDVDELPLSDNLSDPINNALANSDFLITICTPRYPQSRWCLKEIETFMQMHDREHILVVLAEDEPYNSFPEILTYEEVEVKDENGNITFVKKEIEPLAADTRGENKKEILKAMDTAVMKLCAAIFGMNYDDLRQRHREQKIKRMATIFGSIGAAVLLFAIFATVMLIRISKQNVLITKQYAELNDKYAGTMAGVSETLLGLGKKKDAVYAVSKVLPKDGDYNAKALKSLYDAMDVYDIGETYAPVCSYDVTNEYYEYRVSYDNKYILINDWDKIHIFDVESTEEVMQIAEGDSEYFSSAALCGSEGFIVATDSDTKYISLTDGSESVIDGIGSEGIFYESEDGQVTIGFAEDIIYGIDNYGNILYSVDVGEVFGESFLSVESIDFDNGNFIIVLNDYTTYYVLMVDEITGKLIISFDRDCGGQFRATLSENMIYFAEIGEGPDGYSSKIYAINTSTGDTMWIRNIADFIAVDIVVSDNYVYVYDRNIMTVLEKETGGVLNFYNADRSIIECWTDDDVLYFVAQDGCIYYCDDSISYDCTENFFIKHTEDFLYDAKYQDGELYYWFDRANYLTRYSREKNKNAVEEHAEYEIRVFPEEDADDAFDKVESSRLSNYESAFYSDDRKYVFALYNNKTIKIFDAETMEIVGSPEIADSSFTGLTYYEELGNYVLSSTVYSYIMDDDFNVICRTGVIADADNGELVIRSTAFDYDIDNFVYYRLPIVDYTDILEMADDYLGDYEPAEDIKDKYGIK